MTNANDMVIAQDGDQANPLGSGLASWSDPVAMRELWKIADQVSRSEVPACYQNKPGSVLMAMEMATTLRVPLFSILQNVFPVKGNMAFRATFMTTLGNSRGPFAHEIRYDIKGEDKADPTNGKNLVVTAYTQHAKTGERLEATVSYAMADREGWTKPDRNGKSKYQTMPLQMLIYRAAAFLIRRYCPEVLFGCHLAHEIEDVENSGQDYGGRPPAAPQVAPKETAAVDKLNERIRGKEEATDVEAEPVAATQEPPAQTEPATATAAEPQAQPEPAAQDSSPPPAPSPEDDPF